MKDVLGMSHDEMAATFEEWNKGELDSFLIEISANILKYKDSNGEPLVTCSLYQAQSNLDNRISITGFFRYPN
jgi:6-phosphogluconate dehydrogenase